METKQLSEIFTRYLQHKCSKDEVELLMLHFHTKKESLLNKLVSEELDKNILSSHEEELMLQASVDRVYQNLKRNIFLPTNVNKQRISKRLWFSMAAAAVLVIVSSGILFYTHKINPKVPQITVYTSHDIAPGTNSATLTLGNGKKIILSAALKGEIVKDAGVEIAKTSDGELIYKVKESANALTQYHTLSTAKGETYMIVLPDHSKVWLNAASSLKYPSNFASFDSRKVELDGEAYFEIAKEHGRPFKVITDHQEVEVLGTHFNISSYKDDVATKTTLLEGSVRLSGDFTFAGKKTLNEIILKPGQQSVLKQQRINVKEVNIEEAIAWKNGYFMFDHDHIKAIMKKISRWYDVEVEYQGELSNVQFIGTVSRFQNIKQVLHKLELTKQVRFKIEGRRIIVMQ